MSDYPMLISNKLHSFRNFRRQRYENNRLSLFRIRFEGGTESDVRTFRPGVGADFAGRCRKHAGRTYMELFPVSMQMPRCREDCSGLFRMSGRGCCRFWKTA